MSWNRHCLLLAACCASACALSPAPSAVGEGAVGPPALPAGPWAGALGQAAPMTAGSLTPQAASSHRATASPSPSPAASPAAVMLPFARRFENVGTAEPNLDIVVFERNRSELSTLPGVNTPADEFFASFSHRGRYLTYTTTVTGDADIRRYDTRTRMVDTLPALNTSAQALRAVSSDDGEWVALSELTGDGTVMVLYDHRTKARMLPSVGLRSLDTPLVRDISPDDRFVAFSFLNDGQLDIAFYDVPTGQIVTPPFINGPFNDTSPTFSPDGTKLLFVSKRLGTADVFLLDLTTGWIDNLPLLNSPTAEDVDPVFLPNGEEIVFQSNRTDPPNLFIYHTKTQLLDLVPVANPDDDPNFDAVPSP